MVVQQNKNRNRKTSWVSTRCARGMGMLMPCFRLDLLPERVPLRALRLVAQWISSGRRRSGVVRRLYPLDSTYQRRGSWNGRERRRNNRRCGQRRRRWLLHSRPLRGWRGVLQRRRGRRATMWFALSLEGSSSQEAGLPTRAVKPARW